MRFAEKIMRLRQAQRLSQEQVAERFSVSRQTVAKWESGKAFPETDKLLPLARFYGVTVDALLDPSSYHPGGLPQSASPSDEQIAEFLLLAKGHTYAAHGQEKEPAYPGSHVYGFDREPFSYVDVYFGSRQFAGQEVLYERQSPIWSMQYAGRVVGEGFDSDFLKEALRHGDTEHPYRGPLHFASGSYVYHNRVQGCLPWFRGEEEIFFAGARVYQCVYQGGALC